MDKRTKTEGFRSFVSGVMYGTRRGVCLNDSIEIVPKLPAVSTQLPSLRSSVPPTVKGLQAASHRGLCTLAKAMNSLEAQDRMRIYAPCIEISNALKKFL